MWVTVWRHGEAGAGSPDALRTLTSRGEESVVAASRVFLQSLQERGVQAVDRIVASPLRRTERTAGLLGAELGVGVTLDPALAPGAQLDDAAGLVSDAVEHWLLVGHQPMVSELLWYWLDSSQLPPLAPGGWATVSLTMHGRGMAALVDYRADILKR